MGRSISPETLLGYMIPGQAYSSSAVAQQLMVGTAAIRKMLQDLARQGLLRERMTEKRSTWVKLTEGEERRLPEMRPLTISREMRQAMERCAELRVHPSLHVRKEAA